MINELMMKAELESKGFELIKKIGQGGFASVYLVRNIKFGMEFAAKVIWGGEDPKKRFNDFTNEVEFLKKMDHPNIIRIYEYFIMDNFFVIILEYCPCGSLLEEIEKNGAISISRFSSISTQIISAMKYIHTNKIAHHDIKPQNILLDSIGRPKLVDFGMGVFADIEEGKKNFNCSKAYAPPEIHMRQVHDPMMADIWSLAVIFAYSLSGSMPYTLESESKIVEAVCNGLIYIDKSIPIPIKEILNRMLRIKPDTRPTIFEVEKLFEETRLMNPLESLKNSKPGLRRSFFSDSFTRIKSKKTYKLGSQILIPRITSLII